MKKKKVGGWRPGAGRKSTKVTFHHGDDVLLVCLFDGGMRYACRIEVLDKKTIHIIGERQWMLQVDA